LRKELNPEVDHSLAHLAEIAFDESQWLDPLVAKKLDQLARPEVDWVVLDCERFRLEPLALRRRLLRALLERVKGDLLEIQFAHIDAILRLTEESEGNGRIQVPGLDLMRSFGFMRVIRLQTLAAMPVRNFRTDFPVPGRVVVPEGAGIVVSTMDQGCNYNEGGRSLDWNQLSAAFTAEYRLELRNWRPGDSYIRNASTGPEKIKELFQKYRIPLWHRRAWPILVLGDSLVWAAEFGPAVGFAAGPETRIALHVEWTRP
jgi:tRNA(Ile)-lysidine synthase